jgi:hypothetical protein
MALWSNTDVDASKPKYLNTADAAATLGVSVIEATQAVNIAKGINTPGWVQYTTYTDAQSNVRNKSEVLVAMSTITGDSTTDTLAPELTITAQPQDISVIEPATATFSVTATRTGTGTVTFQWQKADVLTPTTWVDIAGATSTSFTTGATTVADDNGDRYRVIVSVAGADSKTSTAATLTVTAE